MRMTSVAILWILALGATGAMAEEGNEGGEGHEGPCKHVVEACKAAGFVVGGAKEGNGVWKDCVAKLAKGETVPNVTADAADVAACKEKKAHHQEKKGKNKK